MFKNQSIFITIFILLLFVFHLSDFSIFAGIEDESKVTINNLQDEEQQTYLIPWSMLNEGGRTEEATSQSYRLKDAIGQLGIGKGGSASYRLLVGFWSPVPLWEMRFDISGYIDYYSNQNPVESTMVVLSGAMIDTTSTDSAGFYQCANLLSHQNYTVSPCKINPTRQIAVSSFDAALILRHMVEIDTLDSLQQIAGDVSGNGSISSFDAALILRYVVGIIEHFPVGARPGGDTVDWAFRPESIPYESLSTNQSNQDYRAILFGDPSGNWQPSSGLYTTMNELTDESLLVFYSLNMPELEVEYRKVIQNSTLSNDEKDELVIFPILVDKTKDVISADILIKYDTRNLSFKGIRTTKETEGFMVAGADMGGLIRIGIAGNKKLNGDLILLEILFEPTGDLEQTGQTFPVEVCWLMLNENTTPKLEKEAEGAMGDKSKLPKHFYLAHPKPNPFGKGTCISFGLPIESDVQLCVFDAVGRKVRNLTHSSQPAGHYSAIWDGKDEQKRKLANGIYFIHMQASKQKFLRKALLLQD